ncbi:hypothetical protein [Streptomyces sp. NPDC087300]|uniref:hypothetical protein n=1 Tax=Streptomyces sp. NPDC087300 TaxID=3365780 RepID=UPI00381D7C74
MVVEKLGLPSTCSGRDDTTKVIAQSRPEATEPSAQAATNPQAEDESAHASLTQEPENEAASEPTEVGPDAA